MSKASYFVKEISGAKILYKLEDGKSYLWGKRSGDWVSMPHIYDRICDPSSSDSVWYDEVSEAEAKKIMGQ